MVNLFTEVVYTPLYNALIFLLSILPHADVGFAIILLTLFVKIALFPLARQAIKTQAVMRTITPQLNEINEKYKESAEERAKATMALYRESGVKPFSSFLVVLIQLPIIFGLYWVFMRGGLPTIDPTYLYSFVRAPEAVSMNFLGIFDMSGRSLILALAAGLSQFFVGQFAIQPPQTSSKPGESLKDDIARSLHLQMRYGLPVIVAFAGYTISSAVALYWTVSNLFTLIQEILVRRAMYGTEKV